MTALVALGANLGDRLATLRGAVAALHATNGVSVLRVSRVYETAPVGPPQPRYLNAAVLLGTRLDGPPLLGRLKAVETALGREPGPRWGPRVLDLDLIALRGQVIDAPRLRVPHPRASVRAFVLIPACEVAPDLLLPGFGRVVDLMSGVERRGMRRLAQRLR